MLTDKIALVTGASRGIGKEVALHLAKEKATVIINYNGSKDAAEKVKEEIEAFGGIVETYQANVAEDASCKEMIDTLLKKYGHIDILVNNAGICKDNLIMRMSEEDFTSVLDINLKGTFHTIKHLSRAFLKQRSGRIINISSVSGIMGNAGQANYSASKAGIIGLTKSIARELAPRGITVNAIAPGFVDTDMTNDFSDGLKEGMLNQIPLHRFAKPEEIASAVVFLASDNAAYITGQVLAVDGGMSM